MRTILKKIPVEQQPKPVVGIPADRARVFPARAISGFECGEAVNDKIDLTRLTYPA